MDYLQEAKEYIADGNIQYAAIYVAIAQAEELRHIAKHVKRIADMTLPEYPNDDDDSRDIAEARSLNLQ